MNLQMAILAPVFGPAVAIAILVEQVMLRLDSQPATETRTHETVEQTAA